MTISALAAMAGVILFPLAVVYAGVMDVMTLTIRNALVLSLVACWVVLAPLAGFSLVEMGWSVAIAGFVFALTFTFFAAGWIGGGDAKLAPAIALWFAPEETLRVFLYAALIGGVLTLLVLQIRSRLMPAVVYRVPWIARLHDKQAGVPYGAAMAPAALLVFPETAWLAHAAI
jgi:prepilin peptidase CpaA